MERTGCSSERHKDEKEKEKGKCTVVQKTDEEAQSLKRTNERSEQELSHRYKYSQTSQPRFRVAPRASGGRNVCRPPRLHSARDKITHRDGLVETPPLGDTCILIADSCVLTVEMDQTQLDHEEYNVGEVSRRATVIAGVRRAVRRCLWLSFYLLHYGELFPDLSAFLHLPLCTTRRWSQ